MTLPHTLATPNYLRTRTDIDFWLGSMAELLENHSKKHSTYKKKLNLISKSFLSIFWVTILHWQIGPLTRAEGKSKIHLILNAILTMNFKVKCCIGSRWNSVVGNTLICAHMYTIHVSYVYCVARHRGSCWTKYKIQFHITFRLEKLMVGFCLKNKKVFPFREISLRNCTLHESRFDIDFGQPFVCARV